MLAQSKLTVDTSQIKHADFYNIFYNTSKYLPDDTRVDTSVNSSNQKIKLLEDVTIDDSEQLQQTISPILNLEGMGTNAAS
jgi:hypothetical protein